MKTERDMQKILTLPFILLHPFIEIRVNNLEELLRKSRQLNLSKSLRLIDQQIIIQQLKILFYHGIN